jgi:hypothetical protein
MAASETRRLDRWTEIWLGLAGLWSLGLVAAAFLVTSYTSTNGPGLTLVQENGLKVITIVLIPFVGVVVVATALWYRRRRQMSGVGVLVWVVFGLMVLLVVLGAFTIGPFIGPIAVFVAVAITRVQGQLTNPEFASR